MNSYLRIFIFILLLVWSNGNARAAAIAEAKQLPDGQPVALEQKIITYAGHDFFYVEEDDRNMGIRVEKAAHGLTVGMRADITGILQTNTGGEKYVLASSTVQSSIPNAYGAVLPLGMRNSTVGGAGFFYSPTTGAGQRGMSVGVGLNNVGLLVKVRGLVMQGAPGDTEPLYIVDGTGVHTSIVLPPGVISPGYGSYVVVTGVVSCAKEHQQITGPTNPAYQDFERRVILATNIETHHPAPVWNYTGRMIHIPAGSFLMGNNGQESFSYSNELPQHTVYLEGYWIGKFEVTRGEYQQFINADGYSNRSYWSEAGWKWKVAKNKTVPLFWDTQENWGTGVFSQTDDYPVVGVTYYEAEAFCKWAGGHLPTEAQWEKAARWDDRPRVFPWGDIGDQDFWNNIYDHNPAGGGYQKYQTAPVGAYPADTSPFGCQDMAGNVYEFCSDWYGDSYYLQTPAGGWIDPLGPVNGVYRTLRSSGWYGYTYYGRCSYRSFNLPDSAWYGGGFRLAR